MTDMASEEALLAFVKEAAEQFAGRSKMATYGGSPTPGEYLAIRWGLAEDCILVIKVDTDFHPVIFQQAIKT